MATCRAEAYVDDDDDYERRPLFNSPVRERPEVVRVRARSAALAVGVVMGLVLGLSSSTTDGGAGRALQGGEQRPTFTPSAAPAAAEDEQEDGAGAEGRSSSGPSDTDRYFQQQRDAADRAARDLVRYPKAAVAPGFRYVGAGHLVFDLPRAPQPGNVTPLECSVVCGRESGCYGFAYFPRPSWSSVPECYLKSRKGA
eukprot:5217429-Prymnesium_polylepis.1